MSKKITYVVQEDAWFGPVFKKANSEIEMTAQEAEYYVPHVLQIKRQPVPVQRQKAEGKK